jgi:hypothetical protein
VRSHGDKAIQYTIPGTKLKRQSFSAIPQTLHVASGGTRTLLLLYFGSRIGSTCWLFNPPYLATTEEKKKPGARQARRANKISSIPPNWPLLIIPAIDLEKKKIIQRLGVTSGRNP